MTTTTKAPPPSDDILTLLNQLTDSITATTTALTPTHESKSYLPPKNSISLLSLKSEVLLSYLHNLSFLLLLKIRGAPLSTGQGKECVRKLVELRTVLEKGVKPVEGRLRYQIEKVIAAAAEEERRVEGKEEAAKEEEEESESESDSGNGEESGSDYDEDVGNKKIRKMKVAEVSTKDLAFKPNPAALVAPKESGMGGRKERGGDNSDGIYRPPKIQAVSMPELDAPVTKKDRVKKSSTLDEFVASELSGAPVMLPSIGSTIGGYGRTVQTQREKEEEIARREYEESNFVRLPKASKKELKKTKKPVGFGGEDWRDFAGDVDRISKGVERKHKSSALDRSRKRKGELVQTHELGEHFEKRKSMMNKRRRKG